MFRCIRCCTALKVPGFSLSYNYCFISERVLGQSIKEGTGTPLQYSCLENPMDRGAWWAAVHGVAQSRTRLKELSSSSSSPINCFLAQLHHADLGISRGSCAKSGRILFFIIIIIFFICSGFCHTLK